MVGFNGRKSVAAAGDDEIGHCYSNVRSFPIFYFDTNSYLIHDSIELTLRYLCSVCELIQEIMDISNYNNNFNPFQIDLCIKFGSIIKGKEELTGIEADSDDDEDDDEKQRKQLREINRITQNLRENDPLKDIHDHLKDFNMKYECTNVKNIGSAFSSDMIIKGYIKYNVKINEVSMDVLNLILIYLGDYQNYKLTSCIFNVFNKFKGKFNFDPNYKRFIIFVDRTETENKSDDIWIFEPYGDNNCKDIPKTDALSYWYFNSSATSLIPFKREQIWKDDVDERANFITTCKCNHYSSMLTFSFHVRSRTCLLNECVTFEIQMIREINYIC